MSEPRCQEPTCPDFGDTGFGEGTCPSWHAKPPAQHTENVLSKHWLTFTPNGFIIGCHCGFVADPDDRGYVDSVLAHILLVALTESTS